VSHRFGTFLFIPHDKHDVRSLPLSRRSALALSCIGIGLLLGLVGLVTLHLAAPGEALLAPRLVEENERLKSELAMMEGQVETLDQRLVALLEREEELRLVADLPPVPLEVQAVGVGGPGHAGLDDDVRFADRELTNRVSTVSTSLDMLLRRSDLVASSMEDVRKSIAAKKAKFNATPSIWPASGFLSSTFSMKRRHPIFHDVRPHFGIDISARRGTPIVATAAGRVVEAGWMSGHGNLVRLDHGHGIETTYSHASRIVVKRGQQVERGDTIALVGSTGFSIATHVHYEVHEDGNPVNPLKYIFPDAIAD